MSMIPSLYNLPPPFKFHHTLTHTHTHTQTHAHTHTHTQTHTHTNTPHTYTHTHTQTHTHTHTHTHAHTHTHTHARRGPSKPQGHSDRWLLRQPSLPTGSAATDLGAPGETGRGRGREGSATSSTGKYPCY